MGKEMDSVNFSMKMEGLMKDNGKRGKLKDMESCTINQIYLLMRGIGRKESSLEREKFLTKILIK